MGFYDDRLIPLESACDVIAEYTAATGPATRQFFFDEYTQARCPDFVPGVDDAEAEAACQRVLASLTRVWP